MKKNLFYFPILITALLLTWSCDKDDDPAVENNIITVAGKVTEAGTGSPVADVTVSSGITSTTTNADGMYSINANKDGILVFKKEGYEDEDMTVSNQSSIEITLTRIEEVRETVILSGLTTGHMTLSPDKIGRASRRE